MKTKTRICPIVLLICAARIVCTAQQRYNNNYAIGYPLNLMQDDYILEKRNKPSLSIVNPLDVLRQRLLLEIARRQMKENTRQVELNRAIMKNVGKRTNGGHYYNSKFPTQTQQQWEYLLTHAPNQQQTYSISTPHHQQQQQQHQLQLQLQQQLFQPHYGNSLEYAPDVTDYDYVQQPIYLYDGVLSAATTNGGGSENIGESAKHTSSYINALESVIDDGDLNTYKANENEKRNDQPNENKNTNSATERRNHGSDTDTANDGNAIGSSGVQAKTSLGNEHLGTIQGVDGNEGNTDTQLRYFYGLRNKRRNMKK